jgi:hypothetical protein
MKIMNQRTAKMLRKWAYRDGKKNRAKYQRFKRIWNRLSKEQKMEIKQKIYYLSTWEWLEKTALEDEDDG